MHCYRAHSPDPAVYQSLRRIEQQQQQTLWMIDSAARGLGYGQNVQPYGAYNGPAYIMPPQPAPTYTMPPGPASYYFTPPQPISNYAMLTQGNLGPESAQPRGIDQYSSCSRDRQKSQTPLNTAGGTSYLSQEDRTYVIRHPNYSRKHSLERNLAYLRMMDKRTAKAARRLQKKVKLESVKHKEGKAKKERVKKEEVKVEKEDVEEEVVELEVKVKKESMEDEEIIKSEARGSGDQGSLTAPPSPTDSIPETEASLIALHDFTDGFQARIQEDRVQLQRRLQEYTTAANNAGNDGAI
ncbi:MAG: hypothetical protein Q9170_001872 [Blastenia crenularia]